MERSDSGRTILQDANRALQFIVEFQIRNPFPSTAKLLGQVFAQRLAILRLVGCEESGDGQVPGEA